MKDLCLSFYLVQFFVIYDHANPYMILEMGGGGGGVGLQIQSYQGFYLS